MKGKLKISAARKILWGLMILAVAAAVCYGLSLQEFWRTFFAVMVIVLLVAYMMVKLLFWRCPHCGRLLGGLRQYSKECYYCGENVEE